MQAQVNFDRQNAQEKQTMYLVYSFLEEGDFIRMLNIKKAKKVSSENLVN